MKLNKNPDLKIAILSLLIEAAFEIYKLIKKGKKS
jgi:hypothetical protein